MRERKEVESEPVTIQYTPDPEKVRAALRKYAGTWSDLDVDELMETLYRARDEGTRQVPRS